MFKNFRYILLLIWFLSMTGTNLIFAQANSSDTLKYDRGEENIWLREVNPDLIDAYRQMPEYSFDLDPVEQETPWQRFKHWLGRLLLEMIKMLGFLWYLRYIIIGGLFVLLIVYIMRGSFTGLIRPQRAVLPINVAEMEDPTQTDWNQLIAEAIKKREFRLATRYHFLHLLKDLSNSGWIRWRSEKTNRDYQYEIKDPEIKTFFQDITRLYEAIWYGNFPIQEHEFVQIQEEFSAITDQLQRKSPAT